MKKELVRIAKGCLSRLGILLFKRGPSWPLTFRHYLAEIESLGLRPSKALCFDTDIHLQNDLLEHYLPDAVAFGVDELTSEEDASSCEARTEQSDYSDTLLVIDPEDESLTAMSHERLPLFTAAIVLIRSSLGYYWTGEGDLTDMVQLMRRQGYVLHDLFEYGGLHLLQAPAARIAVAFEKERFRGRGGGDGGERALRVNEALAFLSAPVARTEDLSRFGGPGTGGYAAGILNPGAIDDGSGILLVARGERQAWALLRRSRDKFMNATEPVVLRLDAHLQVGELEKWRTRADVGDGIGKVEDFRMFRFREELFSNHSIISLAENGRGDSQISVNAMRSRIGISRVDEKTHELRYIGSPRLDRVIGEQEKNWAFFQHNEQLFFIYSFVPFCLLRAEDWPSLSFATVIETTIPIPFAADGLQIRNSVNPIDYDQDHFLFIVHKVYPVKQYIFWAVLIDKATLLPTKITVRPLARGWDSAPVSIIYICSVVMHGSDIVLFGGLNDSSVGMWRIPKARLDLAWIPLASPMSSVGRGVSRAAPAASVC